MPKMEKANISRGAKWSKTRAEAVFQQRTKDVEWMDKQVDIVKDIKAYEDSLKPVEKVKEPTKSEKPVKPNKEK